MTILTGGFCGFTGFRDDKEEIMRKMAAEILCRPDNTGVFFEEGTSLGYKNAWAKDSAERHNSFENRGEAAIVFTGAIYNHARLRESLAGDGCVFNTGGMAELVLCAYEKYGEALLSKLRGVFSFVIWDKKDGRLFGARDCFGVKPLFYAVHNGDMAFATDIKCLFGYPAQKAELNEEALENYLSFQYSVLPETFFKGVFRLPPAHYFVFKDGKMETTRYWEPHFAENESVSFDDAAARMEQTIDESIKLHVADTEVGALLSSGVDSSYLAASFGGRKTFTVGFSNEKYNEITYAKSLADKLVLENYSRVVSRDEYFGALSEIMSCMEEPLADPAAVALYFVCGLASEHVGTALSGEGADELFGGYNIYREPSSLAPMNVIPFALRRIIGKAVSLIPFGFKGKNYLIRAGKTVEERFIGNAYMFAKRERERILATPKVKYSPHALTKPYYDKVRGKDDVAKMQYIDIHFWAPGDILLKAGRMSAAHSLELRSPLLDIEVLNMAMTLPTKFKAGKKGTKLLFRAVAAKRLPKATADKKKLGFPVPTRVWLREEETYQTVKHAFESGAGSQYFNKKELVRLLDEHKSGKKDLSRKIWTVYIFLVWYESVFEKLVEKD